MTTTASGLKYEVLQRGTGTVSPKATDTVRVHYHGTLLNGTVFDSSVERGQPIGFPLNRVIPGWTEGLQLMKVGDKFKFEIPANLAYGDRSPSPKIPPGSTLVFEVELLGIE
jgi:FKBP-type peptidyl-prolyl cis-trans isomerase